MEKAAVKVRIPRTSSAYDISIGDGLLSTLGTWAAKRLEHNSAKILVISNPKVHSLYGDAVERSLAHVGFKVWRHLIGDGERFKNFRTLEDTLARLSSAGFRRTDSIVALGGGVVGDLAGFAASVYLRGIAFLQIPTTLLSMVDSSVGGKTGVNSRFGKNLIGSFYQPSGVLIDIATLRTLPRRELTCGFCEAVKQGAVSGKPLLSQTAAFLEKYPINRFVRLSTTDPFAEDLSRLLSAQITFKAKIVQNDETEAAADTSPRSRKILNFGHTLAHALEKASNYRGIKHGEAVGYGIRYASMLSKKLELMRQDEVDFLNDVVHRAGSLPAIGNIDPLQLFEAFKHDKKQVGNSLHWILLRGIGKPVIVPDSDIPRSTIKASLRTIVKG